MSTEESKSNQSHQSQAETVGAEPRTRFACCGPWPSEGDPQDACPCTSFFRGSRRSFMVPVAVMGLLFTIVFTGWVLGVVAFFRVI